MWSSLRSRFPEGNGWWAALTLTADAAPAQGDVVGKNAVLKAGGREATAQATEYRQLGGTTGNVQLLFKGTGPALFS